MTTLNKILTGALLLAIAVLTFFVWKSRYERRYAENLQARIDYQQQTIDTLRNKNGVLVAQEKVAQTNSADDIKKLSAQIFDLKAGAEKKMSELQAFVSAKQRFFIHDTLIEFVPGPTIHPDSMVREGDVIMPGRTFTLQNKWYGISGKVLLPGIQLDSLAFSNEIAFRIGQEKKSIFRKELTVQAINSNPYMKITSMNSIVLRPKTNAWNRWIKPVACGILGAFVTYKLK